MNSLLHVLCHGEVLHCDPFIHEFQYSKRQDEHSWFCFGVLVDLVYRYRYFPSGWSFSWFVAFRAADNFVQFCEADFHTRKLHTPNSFLLILPFPLFKTYWGEGMRTVGLETSRLRPRLEVLVNFGLFLLLIFSAVVFDRSFVDLLLMSIYWARIFWYTSILKQNSLALLPISDIFPSRLRPVTCFLCWHLGKREESSGSRSTFVECCKPVVNWPCYLCIVKESPLYPTK